MSWYDDLVPFPTRLARLATERPHRTFLRDTLGDSATYAQAHDRVRAGAATLADLGVGRGDTVVTMADNSVGSTLLWLSLGALGAVEAPLNTDYRGGLVEHAARTVGARVAIVAADLVERIVEVADSLPLELLVVLGAAPEGLDLPFAWTALPRLDLGAAWQAPSPDLRFGDPAAIIFTSGTTGPSKAVLVPWGQLDVYARRTFPDGTLSPDDVYYAPLVGYHMNAKASPVTSALFDVPLVISPRFSATRWWSDMRHYGVTTAILIGTMAAYLTKQGEPGPADRDHPLRQVAMSPLVDGEAFAARFGTRVTSVYGMTETGIVLRTGREPGNWRTCGRADDGPPGYEVRLVDEHDVPVPVGEPGELVVRTDIPWTMNAGYVGMPEATARAWRNGWFHTGDLFTRDEQGDYYLLDRVKDAIRRRGENISSYEVESGVRAHPDVLECAAVAVPSEIAEEEVMVVVVARDGAVLDPAELVDFLVPRMPRFMIPRFVDVVRELPKTEASQRVRKQVLRDRGVTASTWDRRAR